MDRNSTKGLMILLFFIMLTVADARVMRSGPGDSLDFQTNGVNSRLEILSSGEIEAKTRLKLLDSVEFASKTTAERAGLSLADGLSIWNTDNDELNIYDLTGAAWRVILDSDSVQTITNKTIDADNNPISNLAHGSEVDNPSSGVHGVVGSVVGTTDSQDISGKTFTDALLLTELGSTPSNPSVGDKKIYCLTTDDKCYQLNSAGDETELGSDGGSGTNINFVTNPGAETNTTGWAVYFDSIAGTPIDGTGGVTTNTLNRNTVSPITGSGDFKYSKGASTLGEGFSYDFTIGAADVSKVITIEFDYDTSDLNYSTGYLRVYIYNKDSATLEESSVRDIPSGTGSYKSYFQADSSDVNYRLIFHVSDVGATAWDGYIDNVTVSPGDNGDLFSPVRIKYQSNDGQTVNHNTLTDITYENKVYDSHNSFNGTTGIFTAPRKINCVAHAQIIFSGASSWNVGEIVTGKFDCLGCNPAQTALRPQEDDTYNIGALKLTDHFLLNQGDNVKFIGFQNSGANVNLSSVNAENYIALECK